MMSEGFGSNFKPFSSPASIPGQSESSCSAGSIGSYPSGAESTMFTGVPATSLEDNAVVPKTCSTNDMDHAVTVDHTGYVMMPHLSRSGSNQSLDSGTAMEDVICKCPCGRTDFSHILNPLPDCLANRHSDSRSFPELDMKSSNKIAQDQLKMKLERQTRIIKQEFITFGLAVRRYAKSIPGIENILKECLSLGREVVEALDFDNLYPKFREGADLINFDILSRCLTHLKLSDESGEENELRRVAEEAAEKYEASFQEFAQQRVVLVPTILQDANGRSNSVYKELKIKVEEDFQSFLVKRSFDFKEVLKRILKLAPDVYLRVTSVREGCVEICFEMIGSHADTHFSLNDVQKQEMLANKITLLEYDGQVSYCCCELVSDESSRDTIKKVYNAVCLADYQKDEVDDVDGSNEHTLGCPCLSPQASIENVCSMEECPSCGIRLRRCSLEYHLLQCKRSDSSCPSSSDESDTEELPCAKQVGIEVQHIIDYILDSNDVCVIPEGIQSASPSYLISGEGLNEEVTLSMEHHVRVSTQQEADDLLFLQAGSSLQEYQSEKALATSPVDPTHETTGQLKKQLKSNVMGFPRPPERCICMQSECLQILQEPYQVTCCGKKFCKACIEHIKANKKPCPNCNETSFVDKSSKQSSFDDLENHFSVFCVGKTGVGKTCVSGRMQLDEIDCIYTCGNHQQELTMDTLMIHAGLTDTQLNQEILGIDLPEIAALFDSIDDFCEQIELSAAEKADVRRLRNIESTEESVKKALKIWRDQNPYKATFKNLLTILLDIKKGSVAKDVANYISNRPQRRRTNKPKERQCNQYFISVVLIIVGIAILAILNNKNSKIKTTQPQKESGQLTAAGVIVAVGLVLLVMVLLMVLLFTFRRVTINYTSETKANKQRKPKEGNERKLCIFVLVLLIVALLILLMALYSQDHGGSTMTDFERCRMNKTIKFWLDANSGVGKGSHISVSVCLMRINVEKSRWPFRGVISVRLLNQVNSTKNETNCVDILEKQVLTKEDIVELYHN